MIVRYKGEKYKCKLKDMFTITIIKTKLHLIRLIRLFKVVFPKSDLLLYMLLLCLWFVFAWISNFIEVQKYQVHKSFLSTLWDFKTSVFSSVILAFAIGSFNHIKEYRKMIKRQHYIYVDSMDDFEEIIKAIDNGDIWLMFHPMYNEHCLQESIAYLKNKEIKIDINDNDFLISIERVQERIAMVEYELKMSHLLVQNETVMNDYLLASKKMLSKVVINEDRKEFEELLIVLFEVVNQLRYPWRKDEKNDSRIIAILDNDDRNDIRNDFYKRMFLSDFELNSLEE